jgi:NAD(P)-dependent dehydrogenase (short-subunit alcohol dehydrogenase family)
VTSADTALGIELVRELCRRGARVIMACKDVELGQDVAVDS